MDIFVIVGVSGFYRGVAFTVAVASLWDEQDFYSYALAKDAIVESGRRKL